MDLIKSGRGRFEAEIVLDEYPENPRKMWDHPSTIVYHSDRYVLGDVDIDPDAWTLPENCYVLPVYAYIHSGISLRLLPFGAGFKWDSGQCGAMYLPHSEAQDGQRAYEIMAYDLAEFEAYLNGHVFGIVYRNAETGEELDSVWGYYGYEYAEEAAREHLTALEENTPYQLSLI